MGTGARPCATRSSPQPSVAVHTVTFKIHRFPADGHTVYPVTTTTAEWLLEIGGLTVGVPGSSDRVQQGQALAAQVRSAAAAFLLASPCTATEQHPGGHALPVDTCLLADHDGGAAACRLAHALCPDLRRPAAVIVPAALAAMPTPVTTTTVVGGTAATPPGAAVTNRYVQALRAAATAVFHCRHGHAANDCWFSPDGVPLCGDVLAVAHRLGA